MINPSALGESILQALTLGVMLIGLVGLIVPVFPGLLIIWLATLSYALLENAAGHMAWYQWALFGFITLLMILGHVIDNIIIARRMRGKAIPWLSIGAAYLAGLLGTLIFAPIVIVFTPVAGILAALLALFGAEWLRLHHARLAFASARSYMIAWGWSWAAVFGVGVWMILMWGLWVIL
ncbi:MAG TPA: DUF456 domain-containing protein [Anaerolineales bacterium]